MQNSNITPATPQKPSSTVLNILRVFAAVCVFLIHFLAHRNIPVPNFVFVFFKHCSNGVAVFFAMSGFLIMESYKKSRSGREYFIKRVARIIPAYYFVLIFGIVVWDIILGKMPQDSLCHLGWLRYFLFLNMFIPSNDYYVWNDLWGLWTMSCFMFYYLMVPVIYRFVKNYRQALCFVLFTVVVGYVTKAVIYRLLVSASIPNAEFFAGDGVLFNMISFSFGTCAWYAFSEGKQKNYLALVIVALAGFLLIQEETYNRIIWSLLTVAIILSSTGFEFGGKLTSLNRLFAVLGKYSFTAYLVHMPILELLEEFSDRVLYLSFLPYTILSVALTVLFAWLVGTFIEAPAARLIKKKGLGA